MSDAFTWSRYRALRYIADQAYADTVRDNGRRGTGPFDNPEESQHDIDAGQGYGQPSLTRKGSTALITDARTPASAEMHSRVVRYTCTMAFRTACFLTMYFVGGPMRWVLFACALVLPYVAVIMANQANQRSIRKRAQFAGPPDRAQLTGGTAALTDGSSEQDHRDQAVA